MITEPDNTHTTWHSPGAKLDYGIDWKEWLEASETISVSQWSGPDDLTLSGEQIVDDTGTSVYVEGGVLNQTYVITNTITTSAGRKDSRIIRLKCIVR